MWPWEHLAVGYLAYSVAVRVGTGDPPPGRAVPWLVVGTQFPDLVDKPLAWWLGVLPSGTSLAHSVFVAVPIAGLAALLGYRAGRPAAGAAFAVGYLSHLPADVLYPVAIGGGVAYGTVLWPLVPTTYHPPVGLLARTWELLGEWLAYVGSPAGAAYVAAEAALLGTALVAWLADGTPGLGVVDAAFRSGSRSGER